MVSAFLNAFRTPDLRKKILFTLGILVLLRLGSTIPTPNVNASAIRSCATAATTGESAGVYSMINMFSGGALLHLSIFALGIMPYITASIILQLLTVVIPRFEALHKEGQSGEAKLTQYTRYLTIGLAVLQSTTILVTAQSGALFNNMCSSPIPDNSVWNLSVMVLIMTGGTGLIMWMAELITDKEIGRAHV